MKNIRKILFAADLTFISEYAMGYALTLAQAFDARLIILHVLNVSLELCRAQAPPAFVDKIRSDIIATGNHSLEKFSSIRLKHWHAMHGTEFRNFEHCVAVGDPSREILEKAREAQVDLVIVGTHSRQDVNPFLFGSTAEKLVTSAPCPVITVRPPFWMVCMKFRDKHGLQFAREGNFIMVRDTAPSNVMQEVPSDDTSK